MQSQDNGSALRWGRYCLTCNQHYVELKSIGKWQCTYHPLPINRDGPGNNYPEGCYDCCGASPIHTLPDGNRNKYFKSSLLQGCTSKDHSSSQRYFTEADDLPEYTWPQLLTVELYDDINYLKNLSLMDKNKVISLQHPGLYVDDNQTVSIRRYDKKAADAKIQLKA
jgi:hypothetical protein